MTREICDRCGEESAVGFTVPDPIWRQTAAPYGVLCLACFARLADRLGLEWDEDIQFWPVSQATFERFNSAPV